MKNNRPLFILIGLSIIFRLAIWMTLSDLNISESGQSIDLYRQALQDHFWEFLFYEHSEPIGLSILHAILLRIFGEAGFNHGIMILPAMISGVLTTLFVYLTLRGLNVRQIITWPLSALYSIGLTSLEIWRYGSIFDHYTPVLVSFFAWSLVMRTLHHQRRYDILLSIAGGLAILIQKIAYLAVPFMVILTAFLLPPGGLSRRKRTAIALIGPLLITGALSTKNLLSSGVFAPSSLTGPNMGVFMYAAKGYDYDKVYEFAERSGAPHWYLWCFRRSQNKEEALGPSYGLCCDADDQRKSIFDFGPIQDYLKSSGETRLAAIVASDQKRLTEKPYLVTMAPELAPHFAVEYGKVTQKLYWDLAKKEPGIFLKQVLRAHYIYLVDGFRFLVLFMKENPQIPFTGMILLVTRILIPVFAAAYLATYGLAMWLFLRKRKGLFIQEPQRTDLIDRGALILIFGAVITSGAFSLVCCENGRWFLQATPYLIPILGYAIQRFTISSASNAEPTIPNGPS